ncbi:MAG: type II toxin-antitoxin system VapB family antitoxin [Phycisphaerae bacterium]|nr:type II toxin-antitoxin system VapB family antitoxin [Phycisphaerae bacterium]
MTTAKVFRNGGSLAVRLPKELGLKEDERVCIKRVGSMILLYPKNKAWDIFKSALGEVDDDFMADRNQPEQQVREDL